VAQGVMVPEEVASIGGSMRRRPKEAGQFEDGVAW
jgi:hypothetical protein